MRRAVIAAIIAFCFCPFVTFAFEPTNKGGYPTEGTAQAAFDEYDYQADEIEGPSWHLLFDKYILGVNGLQFYHEQANG
ncbi:MAG: hypothetical protein QNI91_13620 [Arenicellales bacterium]|nr:hypothetical protein [Arenicellales bacterium]